MREKFGDPRCPPTRVPKLDKMVCDRISQEAVKVDRSLARLQALFLDAVVPLASILEEDDKGTLTTEKATTAAKMALRFVGNASVQMARERRKRGIAEMNNKLIELSEKDSIYENASPFLFGDQFAKEAKEREEQLRCLDKAAGRGRPQNFYNRRPPSGPAPRGRHTLQPPRLQPRKGTFPPIPQVRQPEPRKRKLPPERERQGPVKRRRCELYP